MLAFGSPFQKALGIWNPGKVLRLVFELLHTNISHFFLSEEYLKHICHPMCKKTCISSCAPGCCAGEHKQDFPLYHRKSSHCHPFCKKHCISSCPLTCCTDTQKTSKTWHHSQVHHLTPGCHPMCKKNCVPSCPKACCAHIPPKKRSHCHPLCKTNCLSSCPLSCCSHKDQIKEKCHPLCRKSCLPSCPDECCRRKGKEKKLIMKSTPNEDTEENRDGDTPERTGKTCPGLCPDVSILVFKLKLYARAMSQHMQQYEPKNLMGRWTRASSILIHLTLVSLARLKDTRTQLTMAGQKIQLTYCHAK